MKSKLLFCTRIFSLLLFLIFTRGEDAEVLVFNINKSIGRRFDGIGAISGGGATSKLLPMYNDEDYNEILSILFKEDYFASLNSLKVEIGGDSQSTEGSEASYMHTETEQNFYRGYQWDILERVKEINPSVVFHSLPWAFPGWIDNDLKMAQYVSDWITGAKALHNLTFSTVGLWNEKPMNASYIKLLRSVLDITGNEKVGLIVVDNKWEILDDLVKEADLRKIVYAIGVHYPRTQTPQAAKDLGMRLFASEDYSTFNDATGAACWARTLNRNYVNGLMTSTIAWNAVTAFFSGLPYFKCSLMNAYQPWSGYYEINGPIYITAHHTHFYKPGWTYLGHGHGTGVLKGGGSYVSLISPDQKDFSIIFETIDYKDSKCLYDTDESEEKMVADEQKVILNLEDDLKGKVNSLHVFLTEFHSGSLKDPSYFNYLGIIIVEDGKVEISLKKNIVLTLSTRNSTLKYHQERKMANKKKFEEPFPLPYSDEFEMPKLRHDYSEPEYLTSQYGYFELTSDPTHTYSTVLQQTVPIRARDWCESSSPVALIGEANLWDNMHVKCQINMPENSNATAIFLASRVSQGGCSSAQSLGVFIWFDYHLNSIYITQSLDSKVKLHSTEYQLVKGKWYDSSFHVLENKAVVRIGDQVVMDIDNVTYTQPGFVAIGSLNYGPSLYKYFVIDKSY